MTMGMRIRTWLLVLVFSVVCAVLALGGVMPQALAQTDGHPVVVSFGDSYSSGEGTEDFYGHEYISTGEDTKLFDPEGDFLPHRSEQAWPGRLVIDGVRLNSLKDNGWHFFAISGAVTNTILKNSNEGRTNKVYSNQRVSGSTDLRAEIDQFTSRVTSGSIVPDDIDYVTLTMGGNDVDFSGVVTTSVLNGIADPFIVVDPATTNPFSFVDYVLGGNTKLSQGLLKVKLRDSMKKFNDATYVDLQNTYRKIDSACGNSEQIVVAGYPHLFPSTGSRVDLNLSGIASILNHLIPASWLGVSADDAQLINAAVDVCDEGIQSAVDSAGLKNVHYAEVRDVFNKYGTKNCINPVYVAPMTQDIKQSIPSGYSVHPNALGQQAYAEAVQRTIDELEQVQTTTSAKPSDVAISIVMDVSGSMGDPSAYGSQTKLESAKQQSIAFVNGSIHATGDHTNGLSTKVGVCTFTTTAHTECGLADNASDVIDAISDLEPQSRTNMYAGLEEGIRQLEGQDGTKMMMFLSDGLANEGPGTSSILDLAREAADKGITIYTIGYGSAGDLDEDLLREMASITGGTYAREDPANAVSASVGLFASMMEAQLRETQQVLLSQTGSVSQGGTVSVGTVNVGSNGTLTCYLYWPGSVLDLRLTDPDGVEVTGGYAGYSIDESTIPTKVSIEGAKQGQWEMSVFGREVSMSEEPFYAVAALTEHEVSTVSASGSGGGATDSGPILLLLVALLLVLGLLGVYALSLRRR